MSSYYEDDRRDDRRRDKDRGDRRRRSPVYEEEEIIEARRGPKRGGADRKDPKADPRMDPRGGALVPRPHESDDDYDSVEEVQRSFPPGGAGYGRGAKPKRSKSARDTRRGGYAYDDYDDYDDRARRRGGGKRDKRRDYSSSESSLSRSPPRKERRKSVVEQGLAALGLAGAAGAATGRSKSHDRGERSSRGGRHSRRYSDSESDSRSRSRTRGPKSKGGPMTQEKIQQVVKAALLAGGSEAWRMRKEPGGWGGAKGKRVLTAAVGAAGIDSLVNKDGQGGTMKTIESVIGGLAGNRLLNGSRADERSRSRSRSRGRHGDDGGGGGGGGLGGLGAGALAAAAGKAFMDRNKSKDGGRRSYSSSSDDRGGGRGGNRRSKSVSDYMRKGMGALGIGGDKNKRDDIDPRGRGSRRDLDGYDSAEQDHPGPPPYSGTGSNGGGTARSAPGHSSSNHSGSSEDDESSSEEDRERKAMGKKQLITAGLASIATIHAAHSVYQSKHARDLRLKEVRKGEISPEEARKKKNKARFQDAASIGVAALGIKGAYSEWKEVKEYRDEKHELDMKRAERHGRRQLRLELKEKEHQRESQNGSTQGPGSSYQGFDSTRTSTPGNGYGDGNANGHGNGYGNGYPGSNGAYMNGGLGQHGASAPDLTTGGSYAEPVGPHYSDGNPYAAGGIPDMGPPPPGYQPQEYH